MINNSLEKNLTFKFSFANTLAVLRFYAIVFLPIIFLEILDSEIDDIKLKTMMIAVQYIGFVAFSSLAYLLFLYQNNHFLEKRIIPALKNISLNDMCIIGQIEKISHFNCLIHNSKSFYFQAQPYGIYPYKILSKNEQAIYQLLPYNLPSGTKCYVFKISVKSIFGVFKQKIIIIPFDYLSSNHLIEVA